HPAELAAYRDAEWTGDRDLLAEGPRCEHDVQQAIAPVGDRALEQRGPRKGPADPGGQGVRDLARAERAFECRWSHEDYRLHSALCIDSCILREHKMSRCLLSDALMPLASRAPFLLPVCRDTSLFRANRRRRQGA